MSKILEKKITAFGRSELYRAQVDQMTYGSYAHLYLTVALPTFGPFDTPEEMARFNTEERDPSRLLDAAMASAAPSHELRHFHDSFGTIAGATSFLNHLSLLREFFIVLAKLAQDGISVRLPLQTWARNPECPDYVREFLNQHTVAALARSVFNGTFTIEPQFGGDSRPYADIEVWPKCYVPAFPLQLARMDLERGVFGPPEQVTRWIPIGFDVLLEGSAHALQLGILATSGWDIAEEALETAQRIQVSDASDGTAPRHSEEALILPYRITDLMLSKFLRTEHKIERFPRRWVTELTDAALMRSGLDEFGPGGAHMLPGGSFVGLMEHMQISPDRQTITLPQIGRAPLENFRDNMLACDPPEGAFHVKSPFSAIEYMARYARHRIIAPLFDLRLKYGNEVFSDLSLYAEKINEFPLPPMMVVGGQYRASKEAGEQFSYVWGHYIMLSEVLGQVLQNRVVICCPRAYGTVEGLQSFNLAGPPGCDMHIRAMACGKWSGHGEQDLPDCAFACLTRNLLETVV
jgi:hypothetical protein